jgi:hypothetical protein
VISRFEVYLVNLDPTVGHDIKKMRPCLVVSPDETNHHVRTVIVVPMTTKDRSYPTRIPCRFKGKGSSFPLSFAGGFKEDRGGRAGAEDEQRSPDPGKSGTFDPLSYHAGPGGLSPGAIELWE